MLLNFLIFLSFLVFKIFIKRVNKLTTLAVFPT